MVRYRKRLPPLDTLIFFECALRRGSFTDAAEELFVSQAAVSKRIRQLEEWLGTRLFDRQTPRLVPTDAARRLGHRVAMTLEFLEQSVTQVRAPGQPIVRIASMTAIGMLWLQPRLRQFGLSASACFFNLTLSDDFTTLFSPDNDLALIYGDGEFPGWEAVRVLSEDLVPMAAPDVARRLARCGFLADDTAPLLDYERLSPDWVNWAVWAERVGLPSLSEVPRQNCTSYAQSVGRALEGCGVLLGSLPLLEEEITTGRLSRLDQPTYASPRAYWIAWPTGKHLTDDAYRLLLTLCRD